LGEGAGYRQAKKEKTMSNTKLIDPKRAFPTDVTSPMPVQVHGPSYDTHETPVVQPNGKDSSKDQEKKKRSDH
jgi:hypothetical protein